MDEHLYTTGELAAHFKVNIKTIQRWIKAGKLKGKRVGRRWMFTDAQVRAVIDEGEDKADPKET